MRILKLVVVLITALVICYLGFIAFIVFGADIENYKNRIDFDSATWRNWEETEASMSLRWDMIPSLTRNY